PRGRERRLPQQGAGALVKGPDLAVVVRRTDEHQTTRRDHRTAVVLAAGAGHALRRELVILAERNLPDVPARAQVDGAERAPGRLDGRISVGIQESLDVAFVSLLDRVPHDVSPLPKGEGARG